MVDAKAKGLEARAADLGELLGVLSRLRLERLSSCERKQLQVTGRGSGVNKPTFGIYTYRVRGQAKLPQRLQHRETSINVFSSLCRCGGTTSFELTTKTPPGVVSPLESKLDLQLLVILSSCLICCPVNLDLPCRHHQAKSTN